MLTEQFGTQRQILYHGGGQKLTTGVDVTITIFCDFLPNFGKNGVFLKNQCITKFLQKIAAFRAKSANFV
jgi:hypothetical protein